MCQERPGAVTECDEHAPRAPDLEKGCDSARPLGGARERGVSPLRPRNGRCPVLGVLPLLLETVELAYHRLAHDAHHLSAANHRDCASMVPAVTTLPPGVISCQHGRAAATSEPIYTLEMPPCTYLGCCEALKKGLRPCGDSSVHAFSLVNPGTSVKDDEAP